ncbi:hypothetical protein HPP92_019532 [Vanilla planifolia]|uniref:Uncharacterized protein n=1 Tax=Vanilla planifolia TaxID=51239 RepID=A0A835UL14_VANPL|nr:hypothetical protein HPP92_019532 [Vanilla planifolia]
MRNPTMRVGRMRGGLRGVGARKYLQSRKLPTKKHCKRHAVYEELKKEGFNGEALSTGSGVGSIWGQVELTGLKRILELENAILRRKKIPASMKPSTKRTPHDKSSKPESSKISSYAYIAAREIEVYAHVKHLAEQKSAHTLNRRGRSSMALIHIAELFFDERVKSLPRRGLRSESAAQHHRNQSAACLSPSPLPYSSVGRGIPNYRKLSRPLETGEEKSHMSSALKNPDFLEEENPNARNGFDPENAFLKRPLRKRKRPGLEETSFCVKNPFFLRSEKKVPVLGEARQVSSPRESTN